MVQQNIGYPRLLRSSDGFTLIELMVVMAIIGTIAAISFYGLSNFRANQEVANAEKEFITNLRSVQNKVNSGGGGSNVIALDLTDGGSSYNTTQPILLPSGVIMRVNLYYTAQSTYNSIAHISVCFANNLLTAYDLNNTCSDCQPGVYYACAGSVIGDVGVNSAASPTVRVDFAKPGGQTQTRSVYIEASGMTITSIHE